jgi:hypothetical protein
MMMTPSLLALTASQKLLPSCRARRRSRPAHVRIGAFGGMPFGALTSSRCACCAAVGGRRRPPLPSAPTPCRHCHRPCRRPCRRRRCRHHRHPSSRRHPRHPSSRRRCCRSPRRRAAAGLAAALALALATASSGRRRRRTRDDAAIGMRSLCTMCEKLICLRYEADYITEPAQPASGRWPVRAPSWRRGSLDPMLNYSR